METRLSNLHKMTMILLKTKFEISNQIFYSIVIPLENLSSNYKALEKTLQVFIDALDDFAPCKKKYTRGYICLL